MSKRLVNPQRVLVSCEYPNGAPDDYKLRQKRAVLERLSVRLGEILSQRQPSRVEWSEKEQPARGPGAVQLGLLEYCLSVTISDL